MTDMTGCQRIRQLLGVYVVGAIDPAERSQVDAHLAGCAECREELAGLAGLPALLGRVPMDEAARIAGFAVGRVSGQESSVGRLSGQESSERLTPGGPAAEPLAGAGGPGDVVDLAPLLHRVAQRRRMNRWRGVVAAAAVALIAAGAAIGATHVSGGTGTPSAASGNPGQAQHWQTVQAANPATQAKVVVKYAGMPWGTSLDTEVYGIPAGTTCQFWVLGSHGRRWLAGSWTVASTWSDSWYQGSSSAQVGAVHGFEITSGQKVLVHLNTT